MSEAPKITREEFVAGYTKRSGMALEQLAERGRVPMPCDCGEDCCQGWQMAHVDLEGMTAAQALQRAKDMLEPHQ